MFLVGARFNNIKNILSKNILLILLIITGAFLRLYNLQQYATFLSDQGRDAIVIKRIVTFEHFPAIGAPTSIGQVYLGPFYYYLVSPFLLLFNFQPVGLAFAVALISIIGCLASYFIIKYLIDKKTALFFVFLLSFSSINIELSRYSWNPNLLPLFSFLTLFFFYKTLVEKRYLYPILFGSFFSFSIQFHYLAVFLVFPIIVIFGVHFLSQSSKTTQVKRILTAFVAFLLFSSPLIFFDLRHQFLNSKNFIKLFTETKIVDQSSFLSRIMETNQSFINHTFKINLAPTIAFFILVLIIFACIKYLSNKKSNHLFLTLNLLNIIFYIFVFARLNSPRHAHYYGAIFYSLFLIIAYLLTKLQTNKILKYLFLPIFLFVYVFLNAKNYYFMADRNTSQIEYSKKIACSLEKEINNRPFNIATWPVVFTEDNFLYFLELHGLRPADRKTLDVTNQMFVLCSQEPCQVLNSPSWNINMFGKAKIAKIWKVEDIKIYKLVHER